MIASTAEQFAREVAAQSQTKILEQLSDLITRGLLEVELGPMTLVSEPNSQGLGTIINCRQMVKLRLKDKEYIERLESRVKYLEGLIDPIRELIK